MPDRVPLLALLDGSADQLDRRRWSIATRRPAAPLPPARSTSPARQLALPLEARVEALPRKWGHGVDYPSLARIARECGPPYVRAEVRRRYVRETGRPITLPTIGRFLVEVMGLPKVAPGEHAGGLDGMSRRRRKVESLGSGGRP